jgi:hypothetical protein
MRALGPGSVSSFLKIILDVAHVALSILLGVVTTLALAALFFHFDPKFIFDNADFPVADAQTARRIVTGVLLFSAVYIAGILVIVGRLRRICATLTAGDPFHPDNVRRLRTIGAALAAMELIRYPIALLAAWLAPEALNSRAFTPNLTAWFAVLVVFVLAEVFREGARLRREAELTI